RFRESSSRLETLETPSWNIELEDRALRFINGYLHRCAGIVCVPGPIETDFASHRFLSVVHQDDVRGPSISVDKMRNQKRFVVDFRQVRDRRRIQNETRPTRHSSKCKH